MISGSLARALAGTLATGTLSRLAALLMAVLVARQLGPAGFGAFTFAIGVGMLAGQLAALGWPVLMMRFIPVYLTRQEWGNLRGLIITGELVVLSGAAITGGLLWAAGLIPGIRADLAHGLTLAALVAPSIALRRLRRNQLAALKQAPSGLFYDEACAPVMVVVFCLATGTSSVTSATIAYTGGGFIGVLLASLSIYRALPRQCWVTPARRFVRQWMSTALPMVSGHFSKLMMDKTDVLLLAPLSTMGQVGAYGVAFRISYVLTFPQVMLSSVLTPRVSEAYATGDRRRLRKQYIGAMMFALVTTVPIAIFLTFYSDFVVRLFFGVDFADAAPVLTVLAWSQTAAAFAVPCGSLLLMTGKERIFLRINTIALIANVVANLALIPLYGALGAAIATAIVMLFLWLAQSISAMNSIRTV